MFEHSINLHSLESKKTPLRKLRQEVHDLLDSSVLHKLLLFSFLWPPNLYSPGFDYRYR